MGPDGHELSRRMYLRELFDMSDAWKEYSPELLATPAYPPAYIWHCENDWEVAPEYNALRMEAALRAVGVPCVREVFSGKSHGWGRAGGTAAEHWIENATKLWDKAR